MAVAFIAVAFIAVGHVLIVALGCCANTYEAKITGADAMINAKAAIDKAVFVVCIVSTNAARSTFYLGILHKSSNIHCVSCF